MPGHVFLEGPNATLRPMDQNKHDLNALNHVRNESAFHYPLGFDKPWPGSRVKEFVQATTSDELNNFLICRPNGDDSPNGRAESEESENENANLGHSRENMTITEAMNLFDVVDTRGTLNNWLFEKHREHGYATKAVSLLLDHRFEKFGLNRVKAEVHEGNKLSRQLLERIGFIHDRTTRNFRFSNAGFQDTDQFGLLVSKCTGRGRA